MTLDTSKVNDLKVFRHSARKRAFEIDSVGLRFINQRQEPRFKYDTPVTVDIDGVSYTGKSQDFFNFGIENSPRQRQRVDQRRYRTSDLSAIAKNHLIVQVTSFAIRDHAHQ